VGTEDQKTWNEKHAHGHGEDAPSSFLQEVLDSRSWTIHPGKALEIATGKGRNALLLAERGFHVDAMDISPVALEQARKMARARALDINFIEADLDHAEFLPAAYDLVVNFNFLQRDLIPGMKAALKLGGRIVFETFLIDQRVLGHPRNPAYLLGHNELLDLFREFRVLYYREGLVLEREKHAYKAKLFAAKTR
jgi:SAM-dependent methyltransferase